MDEKNVFGTCLLLGIGLYVLGLKFASLKPDCVGCISYNVGEYLTVVANRFVIDDKEELAREIIKMRRENSFIPQSFIWTRGILQRTWISMFISGEKTWMKGKV